MDLMKHETSVWDYMRFMRIDEDTLDDQPSVLLNQEMK